MSINNEKHCITNSGRGHEATLNIKFGITNESGLGHEAILFGKIQ